MNHKRMRNICCIIFAIAMLALTGCGGTRRKEALENELAYRQLGITRMAEGNYQEAAKMFQNALDQSMAVIEELEIDICYYKAAAQYKSGDADGALETYTALIEYDKKNADAFYLRGILYLALGQNEDAIKDFKSALENDKKNGVLYNKIGENLMSVGLAEEAKDILRQALELSGDTAGDFREKGYAYYLLEDYDNARTYLDKAINMEDKEAVFYLAKMLEAQGSIQQANQLYESYIQDNGGDTETLNSLGCAKMEEGNYEQALAFFQKALETENPLNEQELRRNEITVLEAMLDFAQAKEKMAAYLEDYPEDEAAVREYEFLQSR